MLKLKNLTVKIGKKTILHNINLTFQKNKIYAIFGPNGSGKSTLAHAIAGNPLHTLSPQSNIIFNNKSIKKLSPDKRAQQGIFLSWQAPLSLSGVNVFQLLQIALGSKKNPLALKKEIESYAKDLNINTELLYRSLNEGASGGEKKKLELIQAAALNPKLIIFDEIDTGVDVDALKLISKFILKNKKGKTYILITHYNRMLKYITPDNVLVIMNGKIVKQGGKALADKIEKQGYDIFKKSKS
ncbi:Fe-S cluster assembly ATPase SufC [Patescibacteria group bacterium AH-259-L07]|nr:Fe-S cluster assembly ATPase SufC [Patescibacteria group bacterium AH-259-L07]